MKNRKIYEIKKLILFGTVFIFTNFFTINLFKKVDVHNINGYRAIRTHIDTYNFQDQEIWPKLFHLQKKYSEFLSLQFVSLAQIDFWGTSEGDLFAKNFKLNNGILGGVLVPPFDRPRIIKNLFRYAFTCKKI